MKKSFIKTTRKQSGEIHYKHDLGQHFLYDTSLLRSLVERVHVSKQDHVLEIGPGAGTLTVCLCEAAKTVTAVEVDDAVIPFLRVATEGFGNLDIVQGDIRKLDLNALAKSLGEGFMVVANIPYNITTPIFDLFWGTGLAIKQMSVMVQKEVAHKLVAMPGDDAYGLMSLRCHFYCEPEIIETIPASAFTPPPKVDSAFVNLPFRTEPIAPIIDEAFFWRIVRAGFAQRRKTLTNALKGVTTCTTDAMVTAFEALGLSRTVRGEALSIEEWIALSNALVVLVQ